MKIYKIANWHTISDFLKSFKPDSLKGLAAEALKSSTFEEFERNYTIEIKHGTYWHITDNPNFNIDPKKGPRDMSSMATGTMTQGVLMVTSHLENWLPRYPNRKYVAEIDMSGVDKEDYYQVGRGFGNEFYITNPSKARVIRVVTVQQALRINRYKHSKIPQNQEALQDFYNRINQQFEAFNEDIQNS